MSSLLISKRITNSDQTLEINHFYSYIFVLFFTRSNQLLGVCFGIYYFVAISPLNQICVSAFLALHLFFGLAVSKFLSKSIPYGLRPYYPLVMISASLFVGYFLPITYMWFLRVLISGHDSQVGDPITLKMRSSWSSYVFPLKSGSLRTISAMMHPTDHISSSTEQLYSPSNNSGGRYHMVMTYCVMRPCVALRASPKSQIFKIPSFEQRRFEVFRSLCTIFLSWSQAIPSSKSLMSLRVYFSLNCTDFSSSLTSWSKYSITMYTLSFQLEPATRVILMMLGWFKLRRIDISLREVMGKSDPYTSLSFFMAYILLVGISTARQTTPYCPQWILLSLLQQFMSSHPSRRQHRLSLGVRESEIGCVRLIVSYISSCVS